MNAYNDELYKQHMAQTTRPIAGTMLYNHDKYLEYFNDFLTVEHFAEYYELPVKKARKVIAKGRAIHNDNFGST